jgi:flagellar hook-associated protein 2
MPISIAASLGFGSGIDTAQLVSDLANASRAPKAQRFDSLARDHQARISAVGQVRSDLEGFATSLATLVAGGTLRSQPSVADESIFTASIAGGVNAGALASEVEVIQLARAQTASSAYVAAGDPVGEGTMTLTVGGTDFGITIGSGNNNLAGLVTAINAGGSGVKASISTDSNGSRLVLKGESGAAKAFTLTADTGADPALSRFTYNGTGSAMTLGQSALDARVAVDGVTYDRATNSFDDVIAGVTFTLKKAAPGTPVALGITRPSETIKQTIGDFVSVFNTLKRDIANARTSTGGDAALRSLDQQISALISKAVTSDASINSLSDIGLSTTRDGSIAIDSKKLDAAIAANPQAVEAIFNPVRDATRTETTDPGISLALTAIKDVAVAASGSLESLGTRLGKRATVIADERAKMEEREVTFRARLEKQFGSFDARIGALKARQTYLDQQIKLWTNSGN